MMGSQRIAGVDGCPSGWLVASASADLEAISLEVYENFEDIVGAGFVRIAVDIPIGLPDRGSRACDLEARKLLGSRHSTVFPCPIRPVIASATYEQACSIGSETEGRALAKQAWQIVPKIREVDIVMGGVSQERVFEVHPELCFRMMNGGQPLLQKKKRVDGRLFRRALLARHGFPESLISTRPPRGAEWDDLNDALAALWTAHRHFQGVAARVPAEEERDTFGLRMEMYF